jgi:hypothetical protein
VLSTSAKQTAAVAAGAGAGSGAGSKLPLPLPGLPTASSTSGKAAATSAKPDKAAAGAGAAAGRLSPSLSSTVVKSESSKVADKSDKTAEKSEKSPFDKALPRAQAGGVSGGGDGLGRKEVVALPLPSALPSAPLPLPSLSSTGARGSDDSSHDSGGEEHLVSHPFYMRVRVPNSVKMV